jgi:hypothetical protein
MPRPINHGHYYNLFSPAGIKDSQNHILGTTPRNAICSPTGLPASGRILLATAIIHSCRPPALRGQNNGARVDHLNGAIQMVDYTSRRG